MAVQTSSITTAAGIDLFITPQGVGQVTVSPLAGSGAQPVGVDNAGELYFFNISDLSVGVPGANDLVMAEVGGNTRQVTVQSLIDATDAIKLTDLSVTQAAAAGAGALTYNNSNGVFTYTPPTIGGLGGIALTALSVVQSAASGTGSLVYSNTTGVFTYTPPDLSGTGGISLTDLSVTTATTGSATGALAYNNTTGVFTYTPVAGGPGGPVAATAAEQAAGTLNTVYSSPATSVAKDAAGTTGALLSPVGTTGQRPGSPVRGMLRYNSSTPTWEYYDGAAWADLVPAGSVLLPATSVEQKAGTITTSYSSPATSVAKDAATITGALLSPGGTTAQRPGTAVTGMQRYNTTRVNVEWYDSAAWQALKNEDVPSVKSGAYTASADEYVVVDTAGQTITLPASPEAGDNLLIVISGTFLDTVVARNGSNLMGLAENITIDIEYAAMRFTYTGNATEGWRVN